jgi:hypothetical protein
MEGIHTMASEIAAAFQEDNPGASPATVQAVRDSATKWLRQNTRYAVIEHGDYG